MFVVPSGEDLSQGTSTE